MSEIKEAKATLKKWGLLSEKFDSDTKKILKQIFAAINKMNKNQLQEISTLVGMFNWPLTKLNSLSWETRASWSIIWKKPLAHRASTWSTGKISFKWHYNTILDGGTWWSEQWTRKWRYERWKVLVENLLQFNHFNLSSLHPITSAEKSDSASESDSDITCIESSDE